MSKQGLTRVFYGVGLAIAYMALNIIAMTQIWPLGFALPSLVKFQIPAGTTPSQVVATMAIYGAALMVVGLGLLLPTLVVYGQGLRCQPWYHRIPNADALGVDPSSRLGRVVQAGVLVVFVLWPSYVLGHTIRVFFSRSHYCEEDRTLLVQGWAQLWRGPPAGCPGRWSIEGQMVYEPYVTPWAVATLGSITLGAVGYVLWIIFRPSPRST
jgi:hypothetical protein